jgi:hypothetical protein
MCYLNVDEFALLLQDNFYSLDCHTFVPLFFSISVVSYGIDFVLGY